MTIHFLICLGIRGQLLFRDRLEGAESQDQFDSMLRNNSILDADVDVDKVCQTSMVTIRDNGVPSVDLRRILMDDYKKIVEEGVKSYERLVPGSYGSPCVRRPCLICTTLQ